ncbi:hypothetical protein JXA32_13530 [Candidatus Sumerlaeota bacterium]|nr:hypothetical protein [Candidatus Sumerlaeota bacterium]
MTAPRKNKRSSSARKGLWRFISPVEILVVLLVVFCWILYNIPALDEHRQARSELEFQKTKVERLETDIRELKQDLNGIENGPFNDEKAIRERYRMVKPGERLIHLELERE